MTVFNNFQGVITGGKINKYFLIIINIYNKKIKNV